MSLDILSYGAAQTALRRQRLLRQRGTITSPLPHAYPILAAPPAYTRGAASGASAITSSVRIYDQDRGAFAYRGPTNAFGRDTNNYTILAPSGQIVSTKPPWAIEWLSDAPQLEVVFGANTTPRYRLVVDQFDGNGPRLTQANAFADPGTSSQYCDLFDWTAAGGRKLRRYRLEAEGGFRFAGVNVGPQDLVTRVPHEDLTLVMGDSFTEPTILDGDATKHAADGWVGVFGRALGLRNCIPSGWGGTGYLNPGPSRTKFRDRFTTDIVNQNPARLFFAGGINDANHDPTYTPQMVYDEAMLLFALAKSSLPDTEMGVFSPFASAAGSTGVGSSLLAMGDAIKAAAVANGLPYYDVLGTTPPAQRVTGVLTAITTATASVTCDTAMPARSWIRVGGSSAAAGWGSPPGVASVVQVTSVTAAPGPFTLSLNVAVAAGIPAGSPVVSVGRAWMWGNGKNGTPNNSGPADTLISSDSTHPTTPGHFALGRACAQAYMSQVAF